MTQLSASNIELDVIKRITSRLGPTRPGREEAVAAVDYDWRQCHHYGPDALAKLKEVASKTGDTIAEKLTDLFHAKPDVTVDSVNQFFAREVVEGPNASSAWVLHFNGQKGKICGMLNVSSQTAIKWVAQLLGDDSSKQDASRNLSELEETLLLDITLAIGHSFAQFLSTAGGTAISAGTQFVKSGDAQLDPFADVCKISLSIKTTADTTTMDIILLCDTLDPVVGMDIKADSVAPDRTKGALLECIKPSPVTIDAVFGHTLISIKDMAELKIGDVIVLDKNVGEPIEIYINGQELCLGQLAANEGRYAVVAEEIFVTAAAE